MEVHGGVYDPCTCDFHRPRLLQVEDEGSALYNGQVPSPTPIVGTSGDSISTTSIGEGLSASPRCSDAITAADSQPALPPPTTMTLDIVSSILQRVSHRSFA